MKGSEDITNVSFDILSLEALFLVPRVFSLLSVIPFFGALVGRNYSTNRMFFHLRRPADTLPQGNGTAIPRGGLFLHQADNNV